MSCVEISITDDSIFESVEDFQVELTTAGNVPAIQIGTISIATVLIDDLGKHIIILQGYRITISPDNIIVVHDNVKISPDIS